LRFSVIAGLAGGGVKPDVHEFHEVLLAGLREPIELDSQKISQRYSRTAFAVLRRRWISALPPGSTNE
jgi:hypothetical protein